MAVGDRLVAYFGHHKAASRWINGMTRALARELGLRHETVYNPPMFGHDLQSYVRTHAVQFLAYTNADYKYVRALEDFRGVHVVRDPRDICVSAYFSHRNTHGTERWPALSAHRDRLQRLDKDEGLLVDMAFNARFMSEMHSWDYEDPSVLQLRMEDVVRAPYQHFLQIARFLGLLDDRSLTGGRRLTAIASGVLACRAGRLEQKVRRRVWRGGLPAERVLAIVWEWSFEKSAGGRQPGDEDRSSHFRRGVPGDWRNHFQPVHIDYFKDQYNHVLLKLNYEHDPDWS